MTTTLDIVDIHTHLWPPAWGPGGRYDKKTYGFSPEIHSKIINPDALVEEFSAAGVNLAVVTTTIESLFGPEGPVDLDLLPGVNDWLAQLAARNPSLAAFAVTDAFAGEAGAREAERAIAELGLSGLVIDSSRAGKFLADPAVRPTLDVAARHRVPVFVHPIAHPNADVLVAGAGAWGNSLGRGLMNGIAFLSVLGAGLLDELPDLHLIFATLGLGGIVQAARGGSFGRDAWRQASRPNIYFDTMGDDPRIVRTLVNFFGADRVLAGTDWPILAALSQEKLARSLSEAGLTDTEQRLVAGGNARRLLALRHARDAAAA
ncbi:amidohydrolase family protein (plasmid) [Microvirga sp. RSM25]|uniref:amidohydrolase family protein n=1 Tax=Microvirga sp. RSM25 TaxID=3273802 RepID=UPI00384F6950